MSIVIRSLSDQVFDVLRERILAGQVPTSSPIRQDALAAELGISKIPLREALARLEQEGLLESQTNRGFFVRPMSTRELEEVYALRLKLEPDAVVAGARAATPAQQEGARKALDDFKREADLRRISGGAHNRAFHVALIEPSGNRVTNDFLVRLHILADRYVCKHLEPL
ncbi:MAG TPA: GntR family transcriptional regulator, partial [Novosphingobium sp.]|nr:GntR family transcriptional regulator [Novosphingobium sp.]